MTAAKRLRIAIQKSGRLTEKTVSLLERCGLEFEWSKDRLFSNCENLAVDLMLVRDDDIPGYLKDGVCDLGVVGLNTVKESRIEETASASVLRELGFGHCRLALAHPKARPYEGAAGLEGTRIATSYPNTLSRFLEEAGVRARIVELSGSVEIAPTLDVADAVCDLVSTGRTLRSNGLEEVETILESQCVLVRGSTVLDAAQARTFERLLQRLDGVLRAEDAKYVMMNAPLDAVDRIREVLPGLEEPTVIPLASKDGKVAIHTVAREPVFWETIEKLKAAGASSILVVPIEKMIA
ncbi:MAG: ATP phosphoribosyltransferase [Elusimicrobia bacterium CG_4_9_14_3_um_filter_62_55]|nr:MAG: ATP phosphoribosyltransferase [Elusimicrobia bacterium CG22_combo_CG10-13_8_21_14_all_63_91]PJA14581.1 MAG: ATP phosphoribosyltransferase [Elusimicrobia bacterium CG_4_10_14_0_2_um_filter_63_34]PJB26837.1 MAG: ATP phosphoribosyltransferase [Elusimicrobia bacterium CG_4_9_14_3_um_filter_62_55]